MWVLIHRETVYQIRKVNMYLLTTNPILIAAAVIPAVFLMVKVYKADRLDREPKSLLVSLLFFGILSTAIAVALEELGSFLLGILFRKEGILYNLIMYYGVVAFSEEGSKYFLLKKKTWNNPNFNCQFDAVVYSTFVSLGFALWENIGYVAKFGLSTALARALTAVPGHACFGVFMGVMYGLAKKFSIIGNTANAEKFKKLSLTVPVFMHGTYDFLTTVGKGLSLIFVAFVIAMFVIAYRLVKNVSENDSYIDTEISPNHPNADYIEFTEE